MRNPGSDASAARSYLGARGLGGEVPKTWQLGFAPGHGQLVRHLSAKGFKPDEMVQANVALSNDGGKLRDRFYNRIMFPINDPQGECIAFGGRVVGKGEPKYLNSQETPLFHKSQVLYGMDKAKAAMASTGIAVVVEGYTDVIALHEAGVRNAVATLGTALTMRHIRLLSRHAQHRIVYLFDGDEAGQRAADRALAFIDDSMTPEAGKSRIELAAVTLPDNLDPADFVAQRGAEELQKLIANAQPLLKYGIERRLARHDLSRAEGRAAALADALQVLAPIKDSMLARDYAVQIATSVRAREQDVIDQLEHLKAPKAEGERDDESAPEGFERAVAPRRPARNLPRAEINRRRFERQLLTLAARRPDLALLHADALAQTQWHEQAHAAIAQSMLDVLAEDPAASSARLVTEASRALPDAAAVLTSGTVSETAAPEQLAAFLVEELAIGDAEDAVGALRAQIADPSRLDPDELEMLYEAVAAMQQDLAHAEDEGWYTRRRRKEEPVSPFIWLAVAAVMAVVEVVSFGLITMWFVIGALAAFAANLLGADLLVQIVVFLVVSVVCLVALRPVFVKYRDRGKQEEPTHVGQTAVVVEDVDNEGLTGRVETDNRMTWAARSADGSFIPQGAVVRIVGQESVKLIVERKVS